MDGTFFLPEKPFKQLFTINGFLKNDAGEMKQVPLASCLMSRRRKGDYIAVFKKLLQIIRLPVVQRIVTDFERAIFSAVRQVFPQIHHLGCNFHHQQALMKKVKELGLAAGYSRKDGNPVRDTIQKLMCICYLPAAKIPLVFDVVKRQAPPETTALLEYFEKNWIKSTILHPWSKTWKDHF